MRYQDPRPRRKNQQHWVREGVRTEFQIIEAVQRGIRTRKAIADHLGLKYSHTSQIVRDLIEAEIFAEEPLEKREKQLRLID